MTSTLRGSNGIPMIERAHGAFLGAAVGDALGWPNEDRSSRVRSEAPAAVVRAFQRWTRRSGGRYFPHEDLILAGEYSDDTQLLLCTARSLLRGRTWWQHLATCEVPLWTLYERGGGGASKRAADAWLGGHEPWSRDLKQEDRRRYFAAGGNGVTMRILPHVVADADASDFKETARRIVADGAITHGHPRALLGALAYGYAIWCALRQKDTLEYGGLLALVLAGRESWSQLPAIEEFCPSWLAAAGECSPGPYEGNWRATVEEVIRLLEQSRDAMKQGALAVDRETLQRLGCFDRNVSSAGTVTGVAAVFLASRYAADPIHGLLEAAFAHGADTDTIASMTGGILGAIRGSEWLAEYAEQIQDAGYLRTIARQVANLRTQTSEGPGAVPAGVKKGDLDGLMERIEKAKDGDVVVLPDGREAKISAAQPHTVRSDSIGVVSWRLSVAEGQTFYVKRIRRNPQGDRESNR